MRVALLPTFAASKKEPLAEMVDRFRQVFLEAGLGEPTIRFTLMDTSAAKSVSAIDRVLKRHPEMERFLTVTPLVPGGSESRVISNAATGEPAEYSTLRAISAGVPRSYPFSGVSLHFYAPAFGERLIGLPKLGNSLPGVWMTDNWWVNGRQRALSVYTAVDAEETDKQLPPHSGPVEAVIQACGKVKRTSQAPILAPRGGPVTSIPTANVEAVKAIAADYRSRMKELVERAGLPHRLPPAAEIRGESLGVVAGPRKPALEAAFEGMGYGCRGGSGEFHVTRKTAGNLFLELYLDVGTWSHSVSASFVIEGAGFKVPVAVPVSAEAGFGQYPIGDAAQWQKIVENLAVMVRELEAGLVPEVERAAGRSPEWYQPGS